MVAALFVISVILVVVASGLAVAVSPLFFLALLLTLVIPALLTVMCYRSPNVPQTVTYEQPVVGASDYPNSQ
jgi:hypothetical protein